MTRRKKIIGGIILSIALLLILGCFLAKQLFPAERIRAIAEQTASQMLGMPVRIGGFGLSFRGLPSVRAADIVVGPSKPGELPLAVVKSINVRINLLALLKRQVEVTSLIVDEPAVNLFVRADGVMNLPAAADSSSPKKAGKFELPVPVSLRSFRIQKGALSLINEKENSRTLLKEIFQRLSLRMERDMTNLSSDGKLEIGALELWAKGKRLPVSGMKIQFSHELSGNIAAGNITLSKGELLANGIPVKLTGSDKSSFFFLEHQQTIPCSKPGKT